MQPAVVGGDLWYRANDFNAILMLLSVIGELRRWREQRLAHASARCAGGEFRRRRYKQVVALLFNVRLYWRR